MCDDVTRWQHGVLLQWQTSRSLGRLAHTCVRVGGERVGATGTPSLANITRTHQLACALNKHANVRLPLRANTDRDRDRVGGGEAEQSVVYENWSSQPLDKCRWLAGPGHAHNGNDSLSGWCVGVCARTRHRTWCAFCVAFRDNTGKL